MIKHKLTESKGEFFKVLTATKESEIGVMTIHPGEEAGPEEAHAGDQIIYVIEGSAGVRVGEEDGAAKAGDVLLIPKGVKHHVQNNGDEDLFFLTIYAPPEYS